MSNTYRPEYVPTPQEIRETFADEIASLGGTVSDVFDDGEHIFARAVLATAAEMRPGDMVAAGVAVRSTKSTILVHPYTFRQVCTNGAIAAHALPSRRIERIQAIDVVRPAYDVATALREVRDAVRACASNDAFVAVANEMRSTLDVEADIALGLLPALARIPQHMVAHLLPHIFGRFATSGERSAYGVLNAVTSLARDTRDAETRWSLEMLGGTIPARLRPRPLTEPAAQPMLGVEALR